MGKKANWKHTSILVEADVYKEFKILATKQDTTASELAYQLIKEAVENQKQEQLCSNVYSYHVTDIVIL